MRTYDVAFTAVRMTVYRIVRLAFLACEMIKHASMTSLLALSAPRTAAVQPNPTTTRPSKLIDRLRQAIKANADAKLSNRITPPTPPTNTHAHPQANTHCQDQTVAVPDNNIIVAIAMQTIAAGDGMRSLTASTNTLTSPRYRYGYSSPRHQDT